MRFKQSRVRAYALFLGSLTLVYLSADSGQAYPRSELVRPKSAAVEFITGEELKSKINKNERVTIIDVRSATSYMGSKDVIKGSIYIKLRRLKSRLVFPPLKNVPRDTEVITYCACPSDEASVRAAEVLLEAGFTRVRVLKGGWQEWMKVRGQVEPRPKAS